MTINDNGSGVIGGLTSTSFLMVAIAGDHSTVALLSLSGAVVKGFRRRPS